MSKRNRKRAAKLALLGTWVGAAVAVVASLAWAASAVWTCFFMAQFGDTVRLSSGGFSYLWTSEAKREALNNATGMPLRLQWEWHCVPRQTPMEWWQGLYHSAAGRGQIWIPLWPLPIAGGAIGAACWRHRRRLTRPGCCEGCGYVLAGLPEGRVCPECGDAVPKAGDPSLGSGNANDDRMV